MNARVAAALLLLLALIGGGALQYYQQRQSEKPPGAGTLGQPLLKGLKAADIASISIREPKAAITLQRKDATWTIAERAGFPADLERVRELVVKSIELKIGQAEPIGPADRAPLKVDDSGTRVEFKATDGKVIGNLLVGKKYFKSEPDNPDRAIGDGRFVLLPHEEKTVYVVSDPLVQATARTAEWIARTGFAAEKVKTLEVSPPRGEGWKIERAAENTDWKLAGAKPAEKLEITKVNAASYSLSSVELADVASRDSRAEDTGLDKPTVVTASTFDALTYTLNIGTLEGDNYYATVALAGEPKPEGKDAEERAKKLAARLPRERALAGHTLLIAKSKFEDILKPRGELLAKKEGAKK
ncbi:MAG: DUF4340 domain-containing protein [Betaproteobacteria bacterium]|nr:DUF4340 domain-containing protein [Betaproteobacteria bacterium]